MTHSNTFVLLKKCQPVQVLSDAEQQQLVGFSDIISIPKEHQLIEKGQVASHFFILFAGDKC